MTRFAMAPATLGILVSGMVAAGLLAGCGSNKVEIGSQNVDAQALAPDAAAGRGGAVAGGSGGSATGGATGGVAGAGGVAPTGGTTGVGSGGSGGAGGSSKVTAGGGTTGTGGSNASGGTATGGAGSTGGSPSTGGTTPAGGTMSSGGATRAGGTTAFGGTTGTGGTGGSTGKPCGPIVDGVCADGEICNMPPGTCNLAGGTGTCVVKPQVCTADWQPVCGCDGKTYGNDCMRLLAGVSKKNFDGACPATDAGAGGSTRTGGTTGTGGVTGTGGATGTGGTGGSTGKTCGGIVGATCSTGEFCELPAGSCNSADATGTCKVNVGGGCITVWLPVCGCDGKTYGNDCERIVAGVSKKSDGACADAGVIMTPTLPAVCQVDGDCCVAMDTCTAMAYLVGRTEYDAMVASIPDINSRLETCVSCIQPAVQVQCKGSFCAGEKLPIASSTSPLMISHCGYISVSDAGTSTVSAHAAVDAGTAAAPSTWSCQSH